MTTATIDPAMARIMMTQMKRGASGKEGVKQALYAPGEGGAFYVRTPGMRESFERARKMQQSGATEIRKFMNDFDLQLQVLRSQRPGPALQGLVDNIKRSITKAEGFLRRDKPYGIADTQWRSLQDMIPGAEETIERYEAAIVEAAEMAESERRVQELEQEADRPMMPDSPIPESRFPTGLVLGSGVAIAGLAVGAWLLFGRKKGR